MCAAQSLGGVPVPVYQDSVTEELAYVVEHAGARFAIAENQEQVDKLLEIQKTVPSLATSHLRRSARAAALRAAWCPTPRCRSAAPRSLVGDAGPGFGRGRQGARLGRRHHALHLGHHRPAQGRGAELRQSRLGGRAPAPTFDGLRAGDELLSYLPMAWVGDHIFSYAQGYVVGLVVNCPEVGGHGDDRPARDRPDLLLRAAARAREPDHPGDDPHGGCGRPQAPAVPVLHGARPPRRRRRCSTARPVGRARPAALCGWAISLVYGPLQATRWA